MYQKDFTPLKKEEIKLVNAGALAERFSCSDVWVLKVMKLNEWPNNEKSQLILKAAKKIVEAYKTNE